MSWNTTKQNKVYNGHFRFHLTEIILYSFERKLVDFSPHAHIIKLVFVPWHQIAEWCAGYQTVIKSLIFDNFGNKQINHSQHACWKKESADIRTEKWTNSGSATGDRTQGLWLCAPALWPQSMVLFPLPLFCCSRSSVCCRCWDNLGKSPSVVAMTCCHQKACPRANLYLHWILF